MSDDKGRPDDFGGITNPELDRGRGSNKRKVAGRLGLRNDHVFDYKDVATLRHFVSERGKILPRRMTGLTARQQRAVTRAVKLARNIALLPYTR